MDNKIYYKGKQSLYSIENVFEYLHYIHAVVPMRNATHSSMRGKLHEYKGKVVIMLPSEEN